MKKRSLNLRNVHWKAHVLEFLFNKAGSLKAHNFIEKGTPKFLITLILKNIFEKLLL